MGAISFLKGLGLGAGIMYFSDPDRGRRRRALVRDQAVATINDLGDLVDKASRDMSNRACGLMAEMQAMWTNEPVSDATLIARVRAKIGHVIAHPRALEISARYGRVTLRGPILSDEVAPLMAALATVPGIIAVDNQLEPHASAENVPALQGGSRQSGQPLLTPTSRLLLTTAGGIIALYGSRRGGILGMALSAGGIGLCLRGIADPTRRFAGMAGGGQAIRIQKSLTIDAPIEQVFAYFSNYAHFPDFMANVQQVTDRGNGRSHWVVSGPGGTPAEWDAIVTDIVPNERIAWVSEPGSPIQNAGSIRFQPSADGGTQVHITLSYTPPAGMVGHGIATLFGADPKTELDADLARLKTFLETGNPPADSAAEHQRRSQEALRS
ncbi:MAG TPA: SRPBCC family protein [Chthonomonadaceae bacterium]|nr:SRPBCC family protein [Chthonomonadaceae bacterium]